MSFLAFIGTITLVALIVFCIAFAGYALLKAILNRNKMDRLTGIVVIIVMVIAIYVFVTILKM